MRAVFDLKEIEQDWDPPFQKKIEQKEVIVSEGESFCPDKEGKNIFTLLKVNTDKALIQFSDQFTLKGHEHPESKKIWITKIDYESFSALWTQNGVTKKLKLKDIIP